VLQMKLTKTANGYSLDVERAIEDVLKRYNFQHVHTTSAPGDANVILRKEDYIKDTKAEQEQVKSLPIRELVGSLNYISQRGRADISAAVSKVAQTVSSPSLEGWNSLKRIVKYLKGSKTVALNFDDASKNIMEGYCDSDWGYDRDTRRSVSACGFTLAGSLISYSRKLQTCVALSTAEAELMSLAAAVKQTTYLRQLLKFVGHDVTKPTVIFVDNQAAISLGTTGMRTNRSKHIDLKYFLSVDAIVKGEIILIWIASGDNLIDMLTKDLTKVKLERCMMLSGLAPPNCDQG